MLQVGGRSSRPRLDPPELGDKNGRNRQKGARKKGIGDERGLAYWAKKSTGEKITKAGTAAGPDTRQGKTPD